MWYFSSRVIKGWLLITEFNRGERGICGMTSGKLGFCSSGAFHQTRSSIFFHNRSAGVQQAQTTTKTGVWHSQDGHLEARCSSKTLRLNGESEASEGAAPGMWRKGETCFFN